MTEYIKKLPNVFQTVTEKKFFAATFDQVLSKKDSDYLAGFLGRRNPGSYSPVSDFYIPEPSKNRTWWQLEPTAFARTEDTSKSNIFFYDDLLDYIEYYGGNILNQDRLFESKYYSFGPPIDYDMFVNYQNYYWIDNDLGTISIRGVLYSDIHGKASFNTNSIPLAQPQNLTLSTGMTILLVDDSVYNTPNIVENFGGCRGIELVAPHIPVVTTSDTRDYITIERGCADNNSWSTTNKWYHIDTIVATAEATTTPYPTDSARALRPIIQFVADLALYPGQVKVKTNQPPLFMLYDHNGVALDDLTVYPESNFFGSPIFSYKVNTTPGASVDSALKFPILYTSLGQSSDIVFQNDLLTDRYTYGAILPIDGYYYYKLTTDTILYNSWNLYDLCDCTTIVPYPPCNCVDTSKQRVIDKFVVGYGTEFVFKLSAIPYGYVIGGGAIQPLADLIVSINGIETKDFTFAETNGNVFVDLTVYLTALSVIPQNQPPVVEIQTYTHGLLDPLEKGYYEIPQQLDSNPLQEEIYEISGSNLTQHFVSTIQNQIGIVGNAFGSNNYRDTRKNRSVGSYILQNTSPLLKSMLIASSNDLDFIQAERFSQDEYTKFKNKYVKTATQFINQGFDPERYHTDTIILSGWVDEIIKTVNVSKEFSSAFAYSYMIANGSIFASESGIVPAPMAGPTTLTNYIDLSDLRNALYIYDITGQEKLLLIDIDYSIVSSVPNTIAVQFSSNVPIGNTVFFALYKNPLPAYIPSTPSKLGAYATYVPRFELDTSYSIPTEVIIGHDGSKTIAYGDYRDQLLLELEKRIYNLINSKFRNEYYLPIRLESVKSGYFRQTRYSRQEYLDITESYLNKWSAKNRANYRTNDWASVYPSVPSMSLWKLYNYRYAVGTSGQQLNLPGNWKGIYQYYYDTIFPNTRPWEMLGFSIQPDWWTTQYGTGIANPGGSTLPNVWPNTLTYSQMWSDIEQGIIRRGPSAIYDPSISDMSLAAQPQAMWARPGLSSLMPVDAAGNIRSIIDIFGVAYSGNSTNPFDHFNADWIYGDGGPVEQTWMSTSGYTFNVQEFLYLMKPGSYGELMWDTLGTELSPGMITVSASSTPVMSNKNWQYVQNDIYTASNTYFSWTRPVNKDQIVHAENIDGTIQLRFGYQRWISDRILLLGKDIKSTFGQKVRTLDVNLANKLAGFTNKDTTNVYLESLTPGASVNTLALPSNNFEVILHKSPVVKTYTYSGVIIRGLANGTFMVYGYDLLKSSFTMFNRSNDRLLDISIGGEPAPFLYFTSGATYNVGDIVRYNGVYYVSLVAQTVQKFDTTSFRKLNGLPTVGGISVIYKSIPLATTTVIPYGSIMNSAQEVFDFLIGWGDYLETQGWKFDEVNSDTNQISDWLTAAKQFLFWLNTEWAPDSSIQLSPLANKATVVVDRGYPNDVESINNGIYSILDKFGVAIPPNNTTTDRDMQSVTIEPVDLATGGIYFLQVNSSETEHIIIFDNITSFNDMIYSPLLNSRQQRLRFNGFRSNGWYGKMEAPGYLIMDNQLVPNYDTIVESMRYFYDSNVALDNPSLEDLGRHLIGYENKDYLDNLQVSNDVQYLFYQGAIRQKGTNQAFEKLFRSTKIQSNEIIQVFEEWALKLSNFGNTVEQVSTEFKLNIEQDSGEVVIARLNYIPSSVGFVKQINILNATNIYASVPAIIISPPDSTTVVGRQAKAYAILDTNGRISRIDISDAGDGYTIAPDITISPSSTDRLYSVWQGNIIKDTVLDNIINIDIDEPNVWTVRPINPAYSLKFPTTNIIEYNLPNAGYVNFNDVTISSFNVLQTTLNWGTPTFNPVEDNILWVAKNFIDDWDVYKLYNITDSSNFDVIINSSDELILRTKLSYLVTPQLTGGVNDTDFGNMIVLQVNEARAIAEIGLLGEITTVAITKTGINYINQPTITVSEASGPHLGTPAVLSVVVIGGQVSDITIVSPGDGYINPIITISPPDSINPDTNYTVGFQYRDSDVDFNYYQLLTLDGIPITSTEIGQYSNFSKLLLFKTMRFRIIPSVTPPYIVIKDKLWVDNVNNLWNVLTYTSFGYKVYRKQEPLINTHLFQSATIFSNNSKDELVQLPVYDPFKYILPAPAKQNLSWVTSYDPARYNITGNAKLFSENITFSNKQIGKLWWDTSSVRYVYYEQPTALDNETELDNLIYRRNHWGQIFPGSTVDIYEWVQSDVTPDLYTGSGTPRDITSYVRVAASDRFTNTSNVKYYFWVLNATNKPNIENRTMAALDVAHLLQSPKSQFFAFVAPIQQTSTNSSYMFYNVQEILAYKGNNVQIQYRLDERDDQKHAQWMLYRDGESTSVVTDQYWDKMTDSLTGYTAVLPVSTEYTGIPVTGGVVLPVPDPTLGEGEKYGIQYRPRQGMFVNIRAAKKVFVEAANDLLKHIPIRDTDANWDIFVSTSAYWKYTTWYEIGYENITPNIVFKTFLEATLALAAGTLNKGTIVRITRGTADGRYTLYAVISTGSNSSILSFKQVGIENSAILLLDTISTDINVYALSVELRELLNAFRTRVMIDQYKVDQNRLYFSMMNYVVSEQRNPDWLFKTSYIYIKENSIPLTQDRLYIPDQIDNIISFIIDTKPYHTQIRDYTSSFDLPVDIAKGTVSDLICKTKTTIDFGPYETQPPGSRYFGGNWDTMSNLSGHPTDWVYQPWDYFDWDVYNSTTSIVDASKFAPALDQFITGQDFNPATPDPYKIQTVFDPAKIGVSALYPYSFDLSTISQNNPQTIVIHVGVIGLEVGSTTLIYGFDYFVELDETTQIYTAYLYTQPASAPLAFVDFDGGPFRYQPYPTYRNELVRGIVQDNFVVNVDTALALNTIPPSLTRYPVALWGDFWDGVDPTSPLGISLTTSGASLDTPWDAIFDETTLVIDYNTTVSYKENTNMNTATDFYRNSNVASGTLVYDLPVPVPGDSGTITISTIGNIFPAEGAVWISGERIQYGLKNEININQWELKNLIRGTKGTSVDIHLTSSKVWIEFNNTIPLTPGSGASANTVAWNVMTDALQTTPSGSDTNVSSVAGGGIWYAGTTQAIFLKTEPGKAVP